MFENVLGFPRPVVKKMPTELAVCRALRDLPTEIQSKIMDIVNQPPPAPKKPSVRLQSFMKRWSDPNRPKIMPRVLYF